MNRLNFRDKFTVYFVRPVGAEGPIKIGLSADPQRRLKTFSAWSPLPLELIGSVPGRWIDEQFLHESLADHHSHGEWFHASPLVIDTIKAVISAGNFKGVRSTLTPVANIRSKRVRETRARNALANAAAPETEAAQ